MALPDVAPMGAKWQGENGLSGNEKRRRASELGQTPISSKSGAGEGRPERLVNLGARLRQSMAAQGKAIER